MSPSGCDGGAHIKALPVSRHLMQLLPTEAMQLSHAHSFPQERRTLIKDVCSLHKDLNSGLSSSTESPCSHHTL